MGKTTDKIWIVKHGKRYSDWGIQGLPTGPDCICYEEVLPETASDEEIERLKLLLKECDEVLSGLRGNVGYHEKVLIDDMRAALFPALVAELKAREPSDEGLEAAARVKYHTWTCPADDCTCNEHIAFIAGAEYQAPISEAKAWRKIIDFLMHNAGNYCNCKNAYGEQCDKHAQTFVAGLLEDEAKRRGIKL